VVSRYFGTEDPIGQRVTLSMLKTFRDGPVEDPVFEIIGVTSDEARVAHVVPFGLSATIREVSVGGFSAETAVASVSPRATVRKS
jgi:hypothetical protein